MGLMTYMDASESYFTALVDVGIVQPPENRETGVRRRGRSSLAARIQQKSTVGQY